MKLTDTIKQHSLSLISLFVAFSALGYNTWRNEATEANRNIRMAGFEMIKHIGALQRIAYLAHYDNDRKHGNPRLGWTEVLLIQDQAHLMLNEVPVTAHKLLLSWENNWASLEQEVPDERAIQAIDQAVEELRQHVLETMDRLD